MDNVTTVGIELAKNVFSVHGVEAQGREALRRTVRREQLLALVAQLPDCLIGLEACSGALSGRARRLNKRRGRTLSSALVCPSDSPDC